MLISSHKEELFVEGNRIEIGDDGLGIKLNNTLYNPTKLTASTTTYSYSFDIPLTPNNARILGDINVTSKRNKFNRRFNAILYSDGIEIFNGSLKVTSIEDAKAKCNLYVPKINTLESIFGDKTMNEIDWQVPFKGIDTINAVNKDLSTKYFFPWVAYSLPNKFPLETSESGYEWYSDKKTIDDSCRFYFNSFVPSMNLVETLRKCFQSKGIELQGDVCNNDILNEIYLSQSIGSDDDPLYNYGDKDMGEIEVNIQFKNYLGNDPNNVTTYMNGNMTTFEFDDEKFPSKLNSDDAFDAVLAYNLLDEEGMDDEIGVYHSISASSNNASLYVNGGIQIPTEGFYEITTEFEFGVPFAFNSIDKANIGTKSANQSKSYINLNSVNHLPTEFQLLKYSVVDSDMDSLNHSPIYYGHFPNESRKIATSGQYDFYRYCSSRTNEKYDVIESGRTTINVDIFNNENFVCGAAQGNWGYTLGYRKNGASWNRETEGETMALYDSPKYFKISYNGSDEDSAVATNIEEVSLGYNNLEGIVPTIVRGNVENNGMPKVLSGTTQGGKRVTRRISGSNSMIIKLEKNEMLVPFLQQRKYVAYNDLETLKRYPIDIKLKIKVRAIAQKDTNISTLHYGIESNFPKLLNLGNFLSSEEKMSDWIGNIQKTFNLDFQRIGDSVTMNLNKPTPIETNIPINLDDRVNVGVGEPTTIEAIDFPSKVSVQFNVDTEEEGFYRSVPSDKIDLSNWKEYGDYGYDEVEVSDVDDAQELTQTVGFSHCWYNDFQVNQYWTRKYGNCTRVPLGFTDDVYKVSVPIIGNSEWWIEGYKYADMAKYDGKSKKQRFFFRQSPLLAKDYSSDALLDDEYLSLPIASKWVCSALIPYYNITTPIGYKEINGDMVYLNFKNEENSLLRRFFNLSYSSSDDSVVIEVYITPQEYKDIINGRNVQYNNDVYRVMKVSNFKTDCSSPCKLTLITI